MYIYWRP